MENETTVKPAEIRAEIERANENFMETYRRGDAAGMAALYTRGGMLLPPNSDFVEGHQQIQGYWKAVMEMGVKDVQLQILEVEQCENTAIELSRATLSGENGAVLDQVKYMVIWKRENGAWKLHRDIFNSNLEPR